MLVYCDYIADIIRRALITNDAMRLFETISGVNFDLDENGYFQSTTKKIKVLDKHGVRYLITIEEVTEPKIIDAVPENESEQIESSKRNRSKKSGDDKPV